MSENDKKLAGLWREWFKLNAEDYTDAIACCGKNCFCVFCGNGIYIETGNEEVVHDPNCIYVRAKAIIDQE